MLKTLLSYAILATTAAALGIETNVCGVNWYYCPRDPGCKTYTMSVLDMEVRANDYTNAIQMDMLKTGNSITVQASGVTTIETVPVAGSYVCLLFPFLFPILFPLFPAQKNIFSRSIFSNFLPPSPPFQCPLSSPQVPYLRIGRQKCCDWHFD